MRRFRLFGQLPGRNKLKGPVAYSSHAGLNKGEASNSVRRAVFFHHQGEIRDRPDQQARHPDNQIIG